MTYTLATIKNYGPLLDIAEAGPHITSAHRCRSSLLETITVLEFGSIRDDLNSYLDLLADRIETWATMHETDSAVAFELGMIAGALRTHNREIISTVRELVEGLTK